VSSDSGNASFVHALVEDSASKQEQTTYYYAVMTILDSGESGSQNNEVVLDNALDDFHNATSDSARTWSNYLVGVYETPVTSGD
jgi:hypothetical protein